MRLSNPLAAGLALTLGHFAASLLIIPLTLGIGGGGAGGGAASVVYGLMALATKILYFPILALALYPRHWFPGHLIAVPIAVNSILWGAVLALVIAIARTLWARPS